MEFFQPSSPPIFPLVSVILPTYDSEKFIVQAIEMAFMQIDRPYEIMVIDDGSTDNPKDVLWMFDGYIGYLLPRQPGPIFSFELIEEGKDPRVTTDSAIQFTKHVPSQNPRAFTPAEVIRHIAEQLWMDLVSVSGSCEFTIP